MPDRQTIVVSAWFLLFAAWVAALPFLVSLDGGSIAIVVFTYAFADAGSYLFHYIVDHYGRADHPGIVAEFQGHHADPGRIARRPLVEVLYPAARIITPWSALALMLALAGWLPSGSALFLFVLGSCWVYTQLFHRWAHLREPPAVIAWLQRSGLILRATAHDRHHRLPFMTDFAVINGWTNPLFDAIDLPKWVDWVLEKGLGIPKRSTLVEDMAALRLENRHSL